MEDCELCGGTFASMRGVDQCVARVFAGVWGSY